MNNKNKATTAQGESTATSATDTKTVVNPIQNRLEKYAALERMVKQRKNLQNHSDKLAELEIPIPINEFEETDKTGVEKIILELGSDEYEIKNPTLIGLVRDFLKTTLQNRLVALDEEILSAQI